MNKPSVAVVLLNWNGLSDTLECLESLSQCSYAPLSLYVIDNGSREKIGGVIRERFPRVRLIENAKNLGFAEGNNQGIREAMQEGYDYILVLNNDTIVDQDFLEPLISRMEKDPSLGAVSPLILYASPPNFIWFAGGEPLFFGLHARRFYFRKNVEKYPHKTPYNVGILSGCCMLVSRKVWEQLGLFDPLYFSYWEDTDFCHRLREAGLKMAIVPQSRIWHKVSSSMGGMNNPVSLYLMGRGGVIYLRKHAPWYVWGLFPLFTLGQLCMDMKRGGLTRGLKSVRARIRGYMDGFSGLLRITKSS
jgi:hypothetical protein